MSADHRSLIERFNDSYTPEPNSGCWLWTMATTNAGYAEIGDKYKMFYGHRVAYEMLVGPIPDGLEPDHLCRVRCCVNPDHLELVTHAENMRRGKEAGTMGRKRRTHCARGHKYRVDPAGHSRCRQCADDRHSEMKKATTETRRRPV